MATLDDSTWSAAARAAALARRCARATQACDGTWQAECPAHQDHDSGLSITATTDQVLLHCQAGCAPEAVFAALERTTGGAWSGTPVFPQTTEASPPREAIPLSPALAALAPEDFLAYLTHSLRIRESDELPDFRPLFQPATLVRLAQIKRTHPAAYYGQFLPELRLYRELWVPDLERAVETSEAPQLLPPHRPLLPPPRCPPLPPWALCTVPTTHAAPWLDAYSAHSRRWSPRGITSAHQAVGLWVLSTIAAGRVYCQVGPSRVLPTLFLAMVARSTLYAKSTTAHLGRDLLKRAGCAHLLAADRTTPQALLKAMAGSVPPNYATSSPDIQEMIRKRLAFAAQRGTYMEEWGGMLSQMRRSDSPMAEFHTLLRVLDDGQETYSNDTISRGLEALQHPYLALLASATPHDLAPYMAPRASWWHDGFWPRFGIITPAPDEEPALTQRERRGYAVPGSLIVPLLNWHQRLGTPVVVVEEVLDAKERPTGLWHAQVTPLPQEELGLTDAVYDAYEAYNQGLLSILKRGEIAQDFDASYGRLHDKALRIALLLASLGGDDRIHVHHWSYAQQVVETWRQHLHTLVEHIGHDAPLSQAEQTEQKILIYLERVGRASARDIRKFCHINDSGLLQKILTSLLKMDQVIEETIGRTTMYGLVPSEP